MTGPELKAARERLGWSRHKLAHMLDVDYVTLYRWETGSRKIGAMAAELLRRIFTEAEKKS